MSDHEHESCGCGEYEALSRRRFVMNAAGAAVFAAAGPEWLPKVVLAPAASSRDIIVYIFMRGGADALSLCVPWGDANYYTGRPTLAIPRPDAAGTAKATALDNTLWGFAPGMLGLLPSYRSGELLVIQGGGLTYNSRSHFDAQRFI
jgi:uncharacterized protein (DUF1501 family)